MVRTRIRILKSFLVENVRIFRNRSLKIPLEENSFAIFLEGLKKKFHYEARSSDKIILVPLINDIGTMKIAVEIAYRIAKEKKLRIKYFYVHTAIDAVVDRKNKLSFFTQQFQDNNFFWIRKLCRIYSINKKDIIISNCFNPEFELSRSVEFLSKQDLLEFKYKDIKLGELIYDTYLRFRSKPTVDLEDRELDEIVGYGMSMTDKWDRLFLSWEIDTVLSPYTAYIHWGVPAWLALNHNVDVYVFGSHIYLLSKLSAHHPYHSKDHHLYREIFIKLKSKELKIQKARKALESRLAGATDLGTSYMKSSAFHDSNSEEFSIEKDKPSAVVFLHCFFDSPHIYNGALFPDFHEWIIFILQTASRNPSTNYYIKPHPNGLPANDQIIDRLKLDYGKFKNIIFISSKVSNRQIIDQKPDSIFTLYGTVAHEFAYSGFPVVTAGDNPHADYSFLYNPTSVDQLKFYLDNVGQFDLPLNYEKNEIYEFFYMHYMYYSEKFDDSNLDLQKDFNLGTSSIPENTCLKDILFYEYGIENIDR